MSCYPIEDIFYIINKLELELKLDIDIIYMSVDISVDIPYQNKYDIPDHSGIYIYLDEDRETT